MSRPTLSLIALIFAVLFAVSPLLVTDFAGFDPDRFPVPQDNPPVQPAGYAFAIWGVIYAWLIIGMAYGALRRRQDPDWHAMRVALVPSLAVGTIWLGVAVVSPIWASVLIWIMLACALVALFRSPVADRWYGALPVGLYAGWLSAASCVSLGLIAAGYGFAEQDIAAMAAIFLALVIASAVQSQLQRAPSYGLAVIWALVAIVIENLGRDITVAALAAGGAAAMLVPTFKAWRTSR